MPGSRGLFRFVQGDRFAIDTSRSRSLDALRSSRSRSTEAPAFRSARTCPPCMWPALPRRRTTPPSSKAGQRFHRERRYPRRRGGRPYNCCQSSRVAPLPLRNRHTCLPRRSAPQRTYPLGSTFDHYFRMGPVAATRVRRIRKCRRLRPMPDGFLPERAGPRGQA